MSNSIDIVANQYEILFCHQHEPNSILLEVKLPSEVMYLPGTRLSLRLNENSKPLIGTVRRIKPMDRIIEVETPLDGHPRQEIAQIKAGDFFMSLEPLDRHNNDFDLGVPGFHYSDLYDPNGLKALAACFYDEVANTDPALAKKFADYRQGQGSGMTELAQSELLIRMAPHLSDFVARLFRAKAGRERMIDKARESQSIFQLKFLAQRIATKKYKPEQLAQLDFAKLDLQVEQLQRCVFPETLAHADAELGFALMVREIVQLEKKLGESTDQKSLTDPNRGRARRIRYQLELNPQAAVLFSDLLSKTSSSDDNVSDPQFLKALVGLIEDWCAAATQDDQGKEKIRGWASFYHPESVDYAHLVEIDHPRSDMPDFFAGPEEKMRRRDGFKLTDERATPKEVFGEIDYCLYCHERGKDSCSRGFHEKNGETKKNPLGIPLAGCPLDEKISEAHALKKAGDSISALAVIMIDNPMLPGTGHRICNDCMKSCISCSRCRCDVRCRGAWDCRS